MEIVGRDGGARGKGTNRRRPHGRDPVLVLEDSVDQEERLVDERGARPLEELGPELEASERHLLEHGARREIRGWVGTLVRLAFLAWAIFKHFAG